MGISDMGYFHVWEKGHSNVLKEMGNFAKVERSADWLPW